MKITSTGFKKLLFSSLFFIIAFTVNAQRLPNIQKTNLHIGNKIIINGKASEWGNTFQAYNKATNIFYTIANDNDNLYLVLQARDKNIIDKIVQGGVTFSVNSPGKKNDKDGLAITFPMYTKTYPPLHLNLNNGPEVTKDHKRDIIQADSLMMVFNKQISGRFKIIGVKGIESIDDGLISIYNEEGIKAVSLFDNQTNYTCELAIPIKYLGLENGVLKFTYNIKLNGIAGNGTNLQLNSNGRDIISYTGADGKNYSLGRATPQNITLAVSTDCSGEYTLAR